MPIKSFLSKLFHRNNQQSDCISVELNDLDIKMSRITDPEIPHEVTVVVPRAEIRKRYDDKGNLIEKEILLNSITVVHAPRHPLAGPPSSPPEIPLRSESINFQRKAN